MRTRRDWVNANKPLLLSRQCSLSGVARSGVYAQHCPITVDEEAQLLLRKIDSEYNTQCPFYSNRKLMGILGLAGMSPGPSTRRSHPEHVIYPYLRGLAVVKPNQVWSDITYIRLAHGFVYLIAVIDWYSRKVLA